jgi:hypothetical protein
VFVLVLNNLTDFSRVCYRFAIDGHLSYIVLFHFLQSFVLDDVDGVTIVSELRPPTGIPFIPQMICEYGEPRWSDGDRGNRRARRKTVLLVSATFSTTNSTWTDTGANRGLRGARPATNRLSRGVASYSRRVLKYSNRYSRGVQLLLM